MMEGRVGRKEAREKPRNNGGYQVPHAKHTHTQYAPWEGLTERCERTRIVDSFYYDLRPIFFMKIIVVF